MPRNLNVHLLPELLRPHDLAGHLAIVIDVLRASTTITTALACGATAIVPCLEVEDARHLAGQRPGSLLGGERGGKRIDGFDLGNSPADYASPRVRDKTIIFTTTNGTKAVMRCAGADRVLIGSLVNRAAICQEVRDSEQIDLICAGTHGAVSLDDTLAAGAITHQLLRGGGPWRPNDAARLSEAVWLQEVGDESDSELIVAGLARSQAGRNLAKIGQQADLPLAAELDRYSIVPELDQSGWQIRRA